MSDLESESDNDSGDNGWSGDEDEFQGAAAAAQPHKKNQKKSRDGVLELWANRVLSYSSQYNNNTWSADMIIGKPKVYPRYGDLNGAWAQGNCTNNEFIEIEFEEKLYIESIEIYETLNAGAVTRIAATDAKGSWKTLWQEEPRLIQHSRIFRPSIEPLTFMTNQLRLELDCTIANTWCEIDAVKIIGKRIFVEPPFPLSNLSDELKSLVNSPTFSDCSFDVAGTKIHAHRAILAARSEYFRAMFTSGMVETHTPIPDVSEAAFLGMMQYIYTNNIDNSISPIVLVELIRVADRFQLPGLQRLAHHNLVKFVISVNNVIQVYREASEKLPVLDEVRKACQYFISQNMSDVSRTPDFCALPQALMLEIIQETTARLSLT